MAAASRYLLGMAASFVVDRTLSEKAFLQPKFSDEMFEVFAKVRPFLKELRERTRNPDFMGNVENSSSVPKWEGNACVQPREGRFQIQNQH